MKKQASFWGGAIGGIVIALSGVYVLEHAQAQNGQGGFPRPGQGGFGRPGGGQQGGGFPGGPPLMMGGGGGTTMTATDKYVYVLRGNTLYQFAAEGLRMVGKAELPRMPRPGIGDGDDVPPPPPSDGQK
jgi:hypothetical protein